MPNTPFALLKVIAKVLGNALGGGIAGDLIVEVLPEVAKDGWEWWSKEKDEKERRAELEAIVQTGNAQLRQQISEIVRNELATHPQIVQQTVELYLTQLPASIRRSLRRPDDPSGTTIPANLVLRKADDLLRLLPAKLAHFKPGDQPLPGVDWQLEQLLGVGGFGEVWKARNPHLRNATPVALKFCLDRNAARSLRNEAHILDQVMRQGRHPGMVQLLHTYLSAQTPCLEYEFIEGGDLGGLIQEWHRQAEGPTPQQAARVVVRLAEIMTVAHAANPPIVHRDLKPANILVYKQASEIHFKIADFGIGGVAAQQAVRESQVGLSRGKLLVSGLQGSYTQHYASPQQMRGDDPDPRDDIFALGVIWWQVLTGDLAMGRPGGTRWSRRLADKGMSAGLIDLLAACFEEEPSDRPANAGDLVLALQQEVRENPQAPVVQVVPVAPALAISSPVVQAPTPETDERSWLGRVLGLPAPSTKPNPTPVAKVSKIDFDWVTIPAGEFLMGSDKSKDKNARDDELPQHKLYLPGFKMTRVPVTVAQFEQFVKATGYKTTAEKEGSANSYTGSEWKEIKGAYWARPRGALRDMKVLANHPVTCVSWHDAQAFCQWAGVRLPIEAEWERAARGKDGRIYPWGNEAPDQSRCNFNMHVKDTTPVGSYPKGASPEGLLDMAGNVWEWNSTLYKGYPYQADDGRENGDAEGSRLVRGGAWGSDPVNVRGADRNWDDPDSRYDYIGFRVVLASPGS